MTAITRALSSALLHFVWQGLGVTILLWVALYLLRRRTAALRYGVCCAALLLLVAMPAVTTWMLYEHPAPVQPSAVSAAASGWPSAPQPAPAPLRFDWLARLQS